MPRLTRPMLGLIFTSVLLLPAVGSVAGPSQRLHTTRRDLSELRNKIASHSAHAHSLRQRIKLLNDDITKLQITTNRLHSKIKDVQSEVRVAQAQIDITQKKIDAVQATANKQATALYKEGSTEALDALLSSRSIAELNDRIEMLGIAARENTGALITYGRLRARIRYQSADLFDKKAELARKLSEHRAYQAELDKQRSEMSAAFRELRGKLGSEHEREHHLASAEKAIKARILAAQARRAVENLGESKEGFIWPLNGPITSPYGPRWGTMHTGVDIDGVTGQPIVAAKSGVVIYQGSGMTGYGNTVIIDHGGGISTLYAHMSGYAVHSGQNIRQGHVLGYVGCTGHCFGDHLHFEVRVNGNPVDPMKYLP